ncbi:MAG: hypothetical protein ACRDZ4_06730 [Egibacteraceae bacterium]
MLRAKARGVEARHVTDPGALHGTLGWLLGGHPPATGLVWLAGVAGRRSDREWLPGWDRFLRRLNERRDVLRSSLEAGLLLVGPPDLLPVARDAAPDLWSYRAMVVELRAAPTTRGVVPARRPARAPQVHRAFAELALQPGIEPTPMPARCFGRSSRSSRPTAAIGRLSGRSTRWTRQHPPMTRCSPERGSRARERQEDLASARAHAEQALEASRPLGVALTRQLLDIMASSPDLDRAPEAAGRELAICRLIVEQVGETPESLRDLSVSLERVGDVDRARGELDAALGAYTEALGWYERLERAFGEPYADPDELADLRAKIEQVRSGTANGHPEPS